MYRKSSSCSQGVNLIENVQDKVKKGLPRSHSWSVGSSNTNYCHQPATNATVAETAQPPTGNRYIRNII